MRRASFPVSLAALGLVLLALGFRAPSAHAAEKLENSGFELGVDRWNPSGSWTSVPSPWNTGLAAQVDSSSGNPSLFQKPTAVAGATYSASVYVRSGANVGVASLSVRFFPSGSVPQPPLATTSLAPGAFAILSVSGAVAPAGVEFVEFRVAFDPVPGGVMTAYVDSAYLVEILPPPTSTPTPAATSTPLGDTPTPASDPAATSTLGSTIEPPAGTPTRTPTSTKTPTPGGAPASKNTPTPAKSPTAASTPTPSGPTATPALPPGTEPFGGLIRNGNFEWLEGPRAAWWAKYGGDLYLTHDAYRGSWAGVLASETSSTKWLHQVAPVEAGHWYAASGVARVASGQGEAFLRLSWYEAADGSGSTIAQNDSPVTSSDAWERLETGPVQAPDAAASVRVRLMLRPAGADPAQAAFDDVALVASTPVATPTPQPAVTAVAGARSGPRDAAANNVSTGRETTFPVPTVAGPNSLRLSEILSDPEETGRDSTYEWVEIVNAGDAPLDTAGWKIGDGKEFDTLPPLVLQPGEFAVIAARSAILPPVVRAIRVADGEIGGGLNNSGDVLRLMSPAGEEVDALSFGDNKNVFDPPPPAPGPGRTLGLRVAAADPAGDNWALTGRPTPGEANVFPAPKAGTTPVGPAGASNPQIVVEPARPSTGDGSAVPWMILGVALGAGALGVLDIARRSGPKLRRRWRRGG